jgi:membrane protease subunit HflC
MRTFLLIVAAVVILIVVRQSVFTVDRTEFVYLTEFGRPVAVYDGALAADAGLHFKWPWPIQTVSRIDHRLQHFELSGAELLTHDPKGNTIDKTLTIDAYVSWRVADKKLDANGVDRFVRAVGTSDQARTLLRQQVSSELGAAVARMELEDLVSVEPGRVDRNRELLRDRLLSGRGVGGEATLVGPGLRERALSEYGIEIVDVRVRRINHPPAVSDAIFKRIISERNKKVADYESLGKKEAADIRTAADRKAREIVAEARAEEARIKGAADAETDRIRNEAYKKDPEFYAFLKKLEEYQRILGDKSVLLLSTHRELFDMLLQPPKPSAPATKPEPARKGEK